MAQSFENCQFFSPVNITEKTKKFLHQTEELKPDLSDLPKPQYENQAQSDINTPDIRQGKCWIPNTRTNSFKKEKNAMQNKRNREGVKDRGKKT